MDDDDIEDFRVGGPEMWQAAGETIRRVIRENPKFLNDYVVRHNADVTWRSPETAEEFLRRFKFTEEEIPEILIKANAP